MISPLLRPTFPNNRRITPRAVCRLPSPSTCWIERIVDALTGVIVCGAGAGSADQPCHGLRYRLAGHLTAANFAFFGRKQGNRNATPFLARTLSWAEVANGTSIVFDLRITALNGEAEAETQGRFVAETLGVPSGTGCLCPADVIGSNTNGRHARRETRAEN
jgi:hypothetical protein